MRERRQSQPRDADDTAMAGFAHILLVVLVGLLALIVVGLVVNPVAVVIGGAVVLALLVLTAGAVVVHHLTRPRPPVMPLAAAPMRRALDDLVAAARTKLPSPLLAKVQGVRRSVLEIVPRSDALADDVESLYLVEQTVSDYLPTALHSYLELPAAYATTEVIRDGKTAQELLLDQLTLLDDTMREIADALNRRGSDRLVAHGRFLEERFRRDRDRYLAHGRFLDDKFGQPHELRIEPPEPGGPAAPPT